MLDAGDTGEDTPGVRGRLLIQGIRAVVRRDVVDEPELYGPPQALDRLCRPQWRVTQTPTLDPLEVFPGEREVVRARLDADIDAAQFRDARKFDRGRIAHVD